MHKQITSPNAKNDWHRADIIAAIRKQGSTLSAVARDHGLASNTLQNALRVSWPKGERIIAEAIGIEAAEIWPSRYSHPNKPLAHNVSTTANKGAAKQVQKVA